MEHGNVGADFMLIRARAPLRLGLAGGGTDVAPFCDLFGGAVLNATVDLYAYCTIEPSLDRSIRFVAADAGESVSYDLAPALPSDGFFALHSGVYNRIVAEYNKGDALAVKVTTSCDAPPGSGLGSSSTLVVAMVQAFGELLGLPLGEYDIAALAYKIERVDLGLQGGRQDQYTAAFGGFNFMEFGNNDHVLVNPLRVKDWIVSELESSLVLFYTGRSRDSAAIIAEQSHNVEIHNEKAIDAMRRTKQDAISMKECLLRGDIQQLGAVMESAWQTKKEMAASISNERIEHLYRTAKAAGAYCGKVSGAGGGGFMMFLVDVKNRFRVVDALTATKEGRVVGCHFTRNGAESWRLS
jgi:D-glycero-alpha-D-manno-heptose-7-phosphate kinase